ncbi:hypothetical protein BIW11_02373 [Tropilaelaps mercedesae]|uniref:Uncharacterized protein n=1 Tax=Tropilaelaps mercedesae TaxID=418985 RepID=A0A1V9WYT8_9ACAR|nr:hypothetical protein BIW11_02373 [Tropilaelaps mercedesae]
MDSLRMDSKTNGTKMDDVMNAPTSIKDHLSRPTKPSGDASTVTANDQKLRQAKVDLFEKYAALREKEVCRRTELEEEKKQSTRKLAGVVLDLFALLKREYPELDQTFADIVKTHIVLDELYFILTKKRFPVGVPAERIQYEISRLVTDSASVSITDIWEEFQACCRGDTIRKGHPPRGIALPFILALSSV